MSGPFLLGCHLESSNYESTCSSGVQVKDLLAAATDVIRVSQRLIVLFYDHPDAALALKRFSDSELLEVNVTRFQDVKNELLKKPPGDRPGKVLEAIKARLEAAKSQLRDPRRFVLEVSRNWTEVFKDRNSMIDELDFERASRAGHMFLHQSEGKMTAALRFMAEFVFLDEALRYNACSGE